MKNLSLFLMSCILYLGSNAQNDVTIGKNKKFTSGMLGGEITYVEHLPDGYEKTDQRYPVVYMMNGQNLSQFANDAATLDNLAGERIPDMILIGISNTGAAGNYWSCPDDSGHVKGAKVFAAFLKEELLPEIERNYRTNGYRILEGQSNSALFVIHQFLNDPELFDGYIAASPMFGWCSGFFQNNTRSFLREHPGIRKKLYLSYGDLDYVQVLKPMKEYREVLKKAPEGLLWKADLIENTGHVPYSTLNNALLFFFSGCTMNDERRQLEVPQVKSHFAALSEEYGFTVNPKAGVLLDMVFDLNAENKTDRAIALMEYLIALYPGSEVNQYRLGRLYQKSGDPALAEANYGKALEINPGYEPAREALKKLNLKK
jgi:predicted alpha/beta superfamily hydrolase